MATEDTQEAPEPTFEDKAASLVSRTVKRIAAVVMGLFWLSGVGTAFLWVSTELVSELRKPLSYKPVTFVVTKYTAPRTEVDDFGDETHHSGRLEYSYSVAGKSYSDKSRLSKGGRSYRVGEKVPGWYDPRHPQRSTLDLEPNCAILAIEIFILPFLTIGLMMIYKGLTGKGPQFRLKRASTSGSGRGTTVSGGGPYFGAFAVLCAVSAFFVMFLSFTPLNWKMVYLSAAVLVLVVIPLGTWRIGGWFIRRKKRRAAEAARKKQETSPADAEKAEVAAAAASAPYSIRKKLLIFTGITLFWCGLTSVFVAIALVSILKHRDAERRFRSTTGTVLASKVRKHPGDSDSGPTYEPLVKYRYTVDGKTYTSMRYAYGMGSSSDTGYARSVVADYPKGKEVTVYYDPDKPSEAVLHLKVHGMHYFLLLFTQPFIVVGLGLIIFTATVPHRHARMQRFLQTPLLQLNSIPGWGKVRSGLHHISITATKSPYQLLMALGMGYGLICFLSIFIVGFFFGGFGNPSPSHVKWAFITAAAVGCIALLVALFKRKGKSRLLIDKSARRVSFFARGGETRLAFKDIDRWTLQVIRDPRGSSTNKQPNVCPLLAVRTTAGEDVPIRVFPTSDDMVPVSSRVGDLLAELTGRPVEKLQPDEGKQPDMPQSPQEAFQEIGRQISRYREDRKKYRDLM